SVIKTADYPHSPYEHFLSISPEALVSIGPPVSHHTNLCFVCEKPISPQDDIVRVKEGTSHKECFDNKAKIESSMFGMGKTASKGLRGTPAGKTPVSNFLSE